MNMLVLILLIILYCPQIESDGDKLVGEVPQGDIDEETISKYSQIAHFVRKHLQEHNSISLSSMTTIDRKNELNSSHNMVLEEDEANSFHDVCIEEDDEEESTTTDMIPDSVPMIDTIVDSFSTTIDLNPHHHHHHLNSTSSTASVTQATSGSKKAHSKVDRHIFNKVGGKLRLKPITTMKSLKHRPLRYSFNHNRKVKVIDNNNI